MLNKNNTPNHKLSYWQLSLLAYLKESHPHLVNDLKFLQVRAEEAASTYQTALEEGYIRTSAQELANEVLYKDLLFSKHDMLVNVLWNEFPDIIAQSEAKDFAIKIQDESEVVFAKYPLSDNFEYSVEYEKLYTELTGFIDLWIEENEL